MHVLIPQISAEETAPSVCNNAAWAAGEIAIQLGHEFHPFVQHLLPRLLVLINANNTPGPVLENAAIALGRIGLVCSDDVAPQLPVFAAAFLRALKDVRDNEEKDSAFRGLCTLIGKNPSGLAQDLTSFVIAVAKYAEPSPELADMFHTVNSPSSIESVTDRIDFTWVQECHQQLARVSIYTSCTPPSDIKGTVWRVISKVQLKRFKSWNSIITFMISH